MCRISDPNCGQSVDHKSGEKDSRESSRRLTTEWLYHHTYIPRHAIGDFAILIICGILVAGLWPFHSPRNQVYWSENENGIRFGHYGTILSSGIFESTSSGGPSCSLEIWLEPASAWKAGTVLAFYRPLASRQFSLQQSHTDLALQLSIGDPRHQDRLARMFADEVFRKRQLFITVTSDGLNTAVYIDGRLATRSLRFGFSMKDLSGKLIIANSPFQSDSWSGQVRALALYGSELSAAKVVEHYERWTRRGKPWVADNERAIALYLFDEHAGNVIHNQIRSGIDLHIPERYMVVHQTLLEPSWKEFRTQGSYLKNALINIGGFVPLGFSMCAYFSSVRRLRRPAAATVIVGVLVSFTIEVLQSYLPTRDSGMTDLITNTLGTWVGVVSFKAAAAPLGRVLTARRCAGRPEISPGAET